MKKIPYEYIDKEIRQLVKELNSLGCILTIGSCIGHGEDRFAQVLFRVSNEKAWKLIMIELLELGLEIKDANINIYQWHRIDIEGKYLVDWKLEIEAHPRNKEILANEKDRILKIKKEVIEKIIDKIKVVEIGALPHN